MNIQNSANGTQHPCLIADLGGFDAATQLLQQHQGAKDCESIMVAGNHFIELGSVREAVKDYKLQMVREIVKDYKLI